MAWLSLLLLTTPLTHGAQRINFTDRVKLPDIDLSLQVMGKAQAMPMPSPHVYRYELRQGTKSWKEERYNPLELWIADQQLAAWRGPDGATVRIAVPRLPPSLELKNGHLTRADYESRVKSAPPTSWTKEQLEAWVGTFTQNSPPVLTPISPPSMRVYRAYQADIKALPNTLAYLVLPRYEQAFSRANGKPWVFIQITLPPNTDLRQTAHNAHRNLLGSIRPLPSSGLARSPINRFSKPDAPPESIAAGSPEYEQSKAAARASIRNLEEWWFDQTRYYIILSNLNSQKQRTILDLREHMDTLQEAYRAMIPPWQPINQVSVLRVFREETEYQQYVGQDLRWSDGVWIPGRRELVIRPATQGTSRQRHNTMLQIVRHEGLHQYLFYALDKVETSPWFNEGHASLYEAVEIQQNRLRFVEAPRKAAILAKAAQAGPLTPSRLFALSYPAFYANDNATRDRNYAEAWGLIYYLRRATPHMRPSPYAEIIPTYLKSLQSSRNSTQSTAQALLNVDLNALNADFSAFWTSRARRSKALQNQP